MHEDRDRGGAKRRLAICNIYEHISLSPTAWCLLNIEIFHRKYILEKKNTGWTGLNMVSHIWRDQFDPFGPIENGPRGLRRPQKGHLWPYLAIFRHRLSWLPQMGWTLVEQGWTLYLTSEGGRWTPLDPTKIVPEGPRGPLKPPNDHFRGYLAIFGPIWVFGWLCQIRSSGVSLKRSSKM